MGTEGKGLTGTVRVTSREPAVVARKETMLT